MKTFKISIGIEAKVTIPDALINQLKLDAAAPDGGYMHQQFNKLEAGEITEDQFIQTLLKNALRNITRHGIINDIGGLGEGVGVKAAPAEVTVSVPERVVTKLAAGIEQIASEDLAEFAEALPRIPQDVLIGTL